MKSHLSLVFRPRIASAFLEEAESLLGGILKLEGGGEGREGEAGGGGGGGGSSEQGAAANREAPAAAISGVGKCRASLPLGVVPAAAKRRSNGSESGGRGRRDGENQQGTTAGAAV